VVVRAVKICGPALRHGSEVCVTKLKSLCLMHYEKGMPYIVGTGVGCTKLYALRESMRYGKYALGEIRLYCEKYDRDENS